MFPSKGVRGEFNRLLEAIKEKKIIMLDGTNNDETTMTTFHLFIGLHTGVF